MMEPLFIGTIAVVLVVILVAAIALGIAIGAIQGASKGFKDGLTGEGQPTADGENDQPDQPAE